jgi:MscS family membrane protein
MFQEELTRLLGEGAPDFLARLLLIILALLITWTVQRLARWLIVRLIETVLRTITRVGKIEVQLEQRLSQQLARPVRLVVVAVGLRLALAIAGLAPALVQLADRLTANAITIAFFWVLYHVVNAVAQYYVDKSADADSPLDETIVRFARQIAVFLIFVFAIVFLLQQWGQDVGTLVAGLGIASLAVALAAQDALANIIGYIAIIADAPFKVGDFIVIDGLVKGRVQEISFRSTRIRTLDNSVMAIPNQTIANANVVNWARTRKRRLDMVVGITYSSTADQIQAMIADVRAMLADHERVTHDRKVVEFVEFGDSSLNLRLSFMVNSATWEDLEAMKTDINLKVMHILEANELEVAFPTRTLHIVESSTPVISPPVRVSGESAEQSDSDTPQI